MTKRPNPSQDGVRETEQMVAVLRDFLVDPSIPAELMEFATCEAMRALCEQGWTRPNALAFCRSLLNSQAARLGTRVNGQRARWFEQQLPGLLLRCCSSD